jgi:molybdopterin-binding protein
MTKYRIGEAAALLGVSVDTVRRMAASGKLRTSRSPGGQRLVDGAHLARVLASRGTSALPASLSAQSARNRLPGIVTKVLKDRVAAQVEIRVGPHRMVSLLTREAVDSLRLRPGMLVVACVKATSVVVEAPSATPTRRTRG